MKHPMRNLGAWLIALFILSACAVTPRVSLWETPKRYSKSQVYNAALQAGGQTGMKTTASDRESGTMSFSKHIGKGDMILSVQIVDKKGDIQVRTTGNYAGGIALAGIHEEVINNFHVMLFRNLDISENSEKNVSITQLQ